MKRKKFTWTATLVTAGAASLFAQEAATPGGAKAAELIETGQVVLGDRAASYVIHRLPVSSFPELPAPIANVLNQRGCAIPQTYEAHKPENVIHASLEKAGSSDWAVLCSLQGTVSLLVFFESAPDHPTVLAASPETKRLQEHGAGEPLGFNWGIDPASPEHVHEAQSSMGRRPSRPDHDALADSVVDHRTIYHFFAKNQWIVLDMPN
jgi:hypothetical protein